MPTHDYGSRPSDLDPRRWAQCRARARKDLIVGGFDRLSKKLDDAVRKRALRLFRA